MVNITTGFYPISVADYPNINNCLAFALGQLKSVPSSSTYYNLDDDLPISQAFINKCREFGIKATEVTDKQYHLKKDEYIIYVYSGMFNFYTPVYGFIPCRDFHLVRQEPDGTLVHKYGWDIPPEVVTDDILEEIKAEYKDKPAIFVLKVGE